LLFTTLFDVVLARTLWLRQHQPSLSAVFTTGFAVKTALLVLEAQHKRSLAPSVSVSREAESGMYVRSLFWWLNSLFLKGFRQDLLLDDLGLLQDEFSSGNLAQQMRDAWEHAVGKSSLQQPKTQKRGATLFLAICSALKCPLLVPVPARLAFMGFSFAQPFLITAAITDVQQPSANKEANRGYGLIGATALVYVGIAVSHPPLLHCVCLPLTRLGTTDLPGTIWLLHLQGRHQDPRLPGRHHLPQDHTGYAFVSQGLCLADPDERRCRPHCPHC
jgi:hypothetical protein